MKLHVPNIDSSGYQLHPDGRFAIRDYNRKKPFSNFLPGIAGLYGTPMWVFYVSRGQGVSSFGTRNKDNAILEFFPVNKAYQEVSRLGFRTFIKVNRRGKRMSYEPFKDTPATNSKGARPEQVMEVSSHEFSIQDTHHAAGLNVAVKYWTIPGEALAVLVREVTLTNLGGEAVELDVLDGLPAVNPYGMNEHFVKNMSRTIEAWMRVENVEKKAAFYRLKVDATDRPEVEIIKEGNFYFSFSKTGTGRAKLLDPIVDPAVVFGRHLDFVGPESFYEDSSFGLLGKKHQALENKTPCAFVSAEARLGPKKSLKVVSFFGQAESVELVNAYTRRAFRPDYVESKQAENKALIDGIKSRMFTASASAEYDLYCGQTFLDNVMRGGLPVVFENRRASSDNDASVFYVYSRKHGDPERDYNRFLVEPTYFSQGDGNYRDVNQNRRNDVWFEPAVKDANVKTFLNFIQLDGFNPLVVKGAQYRFKRTKEGLKILGRYFKSSSARARCESFAGRLFDPGSLCRFLEREGLMEKNKFGEFFAEWSRCLQKEERAEHGEGFWVDHWTYNLDLIESYFAIYPEDKADLLLVRKEFSFYDNEYRVQPRAEKYFEKHKGSIRQYRSVIHDPEKTALLHKRESSLELVRTRGGRGEIYYTTLFVKLFCLFTNKFASLDPAGGGIQMEADKPSWLDALNGLPGLLGSSVCETFELKRLAVFLAHALEDLEVSLNSQAEVPEELYALIRRISLALESHWKDKSASRDFKFWDSSSSALERFRAETRLGLSGKESRVKFSELKAFLEHAREKIDVGLEKVFNLKAGRIPTYFENEVTRYSTIRPATTASAGKASLSPLRARALEFTQKPLPLFLEGPMHALKVETDPERRRMLLRAVRQSGLYDTKLGMYKVSESLERVSLETGRVRVFNPGWLENESVWLHMEYKFLLEMLKGGMDEEFFKDFKKVLVPYQPPERYGRSILENSSFIVSSAFSDASLHGAGFVARLSGSTAEFLAMWLLMNIGKRPFILGHDKKLSLRFEPHLPAFLFTQEDSTREWVDAAGRPSKIRVPKDSFAFLFLGKTLVVYHNPRKLDTFGKLRASVKKISLSNARGAVFAEFKGDTVASPYAAKVRDERVPRIDIELA